MQKATQELKTSELSSGFVREQEFSFVGPGSKCEKSTPLPNGLHLAREPPASDRNFELTFQRHGDCIASLPLKREDNLQKHIQERQKHEEIKGQKRVHGKDSALVHESEIQKTEHSSSSDGQHEADRKIEFEQSQKNAKVEPMKPQRISFLIKKSDTQEFIELNCELPNVYESQILLNKNIEDYGPDQANICGEECIQFSKFKITLAGIKKLKIYPVIVKKKSFRIKITHEKEVYNMGVELRRQLYYLPEHYIWFAKLINARLMQMGYAVGKGSNSTHLHTNGIFNQGIIYKCSKYRKKWEKRYVLINNEGLFSYKNPKENYTVHIPTATLEELWTEFELHDSCLIIKLKHKGDKTCFAIPVLDYCLKEDSMNWLFSFYRLLMEHKIHIKI